ncbi:MAG: hypothetical protein HY697_04305 [Deltaproteobacteria bacterium]|nr:hypothetical protein [Deltaproteobacteria bacterium]
MIPFPFFIGIFLISAATLSLEVTLTRLLSVAQWHHFAFLVVSMALLGFGASGSFLFTFPRLFRRLEPARSSGLFSLSTLLSCVLSHLIPFDLARIAWDRWQVLYVLLYYLIFSVPFFFSGLTLSSTLARFSAQSGKIYAADLAGAALGCLLVLFLFGLWGGSGAFLFSSLLGALAAAAFSCRKGKVLSLEWLWAGSLAALLLWAPSLFDLPLSPYKGLSAALRFPGARLLETHWNSFSRVDVLETPAARTAPGLGLDFLDPLPPQLGITLDGDRLSAITRLRGGREELRFIDFLPSSLPYQLARAGRALILEPRGGLEVLIALHHRMPEVVVAEPNPILSGLLRGKYAEYSGGIYLRREVRVVQEDGRSFLGRRPPEFDLIVLPLTESLGASASGFSGLQEDYRLTAEAFGEYLRALRPGGLLAVSLYLLPPPRGELRLVSTLQEALRRTGKRAENHLLIFRSWGTFTLLAHKDPVGPREIAALKSFARRLRFDLVHYPGMSIAEANLFNRFSTPLYFTAVRRALTEGERFYHAYPFDIHPATDDRPFFQHFFRWAHLGEVYRLAGEKWPILIEGGYLLPIIFLQGLILSLLFIALPLAFRRREPGGLTFSWILYFSALGLAFMFVEISFIQKFILFLGHPVYAVSLVLFSLLLSAGLGSRLSTRLDPARSKVLKVILLMISALILLYAFLLPTVLSFFQGQPLLMRQLLTFLIAAPPGLLMGMPFPLGIRLVGARWAPFVPWAWCANGCASVLGSILPVILALAWGFQNVFFIAALLYLLGLAAIANDR